MTSISIEGEYLTKTLTDLVRIDSINPSISPSGAGEAEIAAYVARALGELGLEAAVQEHDAGRASAVGVMRGSGGGRSLMLNAHCDTVGVEGMAEPFSASVREGKLYGRGAYDMKGSLAAQMAAAKALRDAGVSLAGDLVVVAAADEEYRSVGTSEVMKRYPVDGAVVTEPTEFDVCIAHKGFAWLEVKTTGVAAHGSRVDEGVDANMLMGRFLHELERLERELRGREGHPLAGAPSLHAAKIFGGTEPSTYAAECVLTVERRTVPGETGESALGELSSIVENLSAADPSFSAAARTILVRDPFEVPSTAPVVGAVADATREVLGREPVFSGRAWWTDAGVLCAGGIESVVAGPAGGGPHSAQEWVDLGSLVDFARILAYTAIDYCNRPGSG
jgi:acetylornithine deacetylase